MTEKDELWATEPAKGAPPATEAGMEEAGLAPFVEILKDFTKDADSILSNPPFDFEAAGVIDILKLRLSMCDYNAGFVLDGFQSCHKYLTPRTLVEVLYGLGERLQLITLVPGEKTATEEAADASGEGGEGAGADGEAAAAELSEEKPVEEMTEEEIEAKRVEKVEVGMKAFYDFKTAELTAEVAALKEEQEGLNAKIDAEKEEDGEVDVADADDLKILDRKIAEREEELAAIEGMDLSKNREFIEYYCGIFKELMGEGRRSNSSAG